MKFEWDEPKNKKNLEKHKISFEDSSDVFNDPNRIIYSQVRNNEKRYLTVGKAWGAIISVVYTVRKVAVRIISARISNKKERRTYLTKKLSKKIII
jgi:uncharacterized DUF497 family protein